MNEFENIIRTELHYRAKLVLPGLAGVLLLLLILTCPAQEAPDIAGPVAVSFTTLTSTENNAHEHANLLNDMFRLRARVFRDRLKWNVEVVDGMERDRYDNEDPVYIISTDENRKRVIGSLRLLPTTGPTLLSSRTFPR